MHRYVQPALAFQNERQRNDTWLFLTQELTPVDSASFGWAHAFHAVGDPGQHNDVTHTDPPTASPAMPATTTARTC